MAKVKHIKFYTGHRRFLPVETRSTGRVKRLLFFLANKIFDVFYFVGLGIIKSFSGIKKLITWSIFYAAKSVADFFKALGRGIKSQIRNTVELAPKRLMRLKQPQFARSLAIFLAVAAIGWAGISSLHLIAQGLQLKTDIMQTAALGDSYLSQAKNQLGSQDVAGAQDSFTRAYQTFGQAQNQLAQNGAAINALLSLLPQKQDADNLLSAASLVAAAGQDFTQLDARLKTFHYSTAGISFGSEPVSQALSDINSGLNDASNKITQANQLISKVNPGDLPQSQQESFVTLSQELQNGQIALANLNQLFGPIESLLTGQKTVLLLFENNNELRAGGGFIGTYGALKMDNGQISQLNVSSIYDLDGQLTQVIQPPQPILNLSDRWFMRDSNWFADFPQTAQKVSDFYELEGGETPDVILAITPNIIIDILKLTGPVYLPQYNLTLTADNFVEQTQAVSTISDNLPTNSPKQILADFVPLLLQKLGTQPKSAAGQLIIALQNELNNKQVVLYSRDQNLQSQFESFGWAGNVQTTDRDYFMVVSSNLGGTKTDLEMDQQINLTTTVNADGSISEEADITRTNKMPDLADTENDSYIRVYVPQGSQLVSNTGFDYKNLQYPPNENYTIDNDVYNWEKNSLTDNLTGTTIGQEAGKTFFGNWLNVKGGESKTVKLVYQLPFKLSDVDRYSLLLQKQIGANNSAFNWTLNFTNRQIAWKNFDTNALNTDNLNVNLTLDKDYFLGAVLQKR